MLKLRRGTLLALLAVAGFAPLTQAHGMPGPSHPAVGAAEQAISAVIRRDGRDGRGGRHDGRDGISLDEAVSRAERQYRARVVRTDVQDEDGRKVYVLKLLSEDGRVFTVRIDASTGRSR